jgi:two-component system, NtrC family, sensor kinase
MTFTIDKKVSLFECVIILVLGLVITAYFMRYQTKVLHSELNERTGVLLSYLAHNLEYPVEVGDREAVARLAKGVMAQEDIIYCRVEDRTGAALYEEGALALPFRSFRCPIRVRKAAAAQEALILNIPETKEEEIGNVRLAVSLSRLDMKIADMRRTMMALVALAIALAAAGTYLLLKKLIGTPVDMLVHATKKIAAGDLSCAIPSPNRDEFGVLADSFNTMTTSLREAQEELVRKENLFVLGQLSGIVGHELRNPLGVINNAVYFLKTVMSDTDETVKEHLAMIKNEVDSCERIISDLLDFSRAKTPQVKPVSANELIAASLEKCAVPENVTVEIDIPESLADVEIDPFQMVQVFQNLITNAVQAMPEGGVLRISTRQGDRDLGSGAGEKKPIAALRSTTPDGDFVEISVTDTGKGISSENMKKLFQPLFTTKAKGIGLGLVVSKKLAEANGGSIAAASKSGKGATFTVTLPSMRGSIYP